MILRRKKPGRKRDVGLKEEFMACSVAAETWSFGKASCRYVNNFCTVTRIYTTWALFLALTFKVHYFAGHRKKKFEDSLGIPQASLS